MTGLCYDWLLIDMFDGDVTTKSNDHTLLMEDMK